MESGRIRRIPKRTGGEGTGRVREKQVERVEETILTVTASGVGIEEDRREAIGVRVFETEPAYVRVSAGSTRNTGPYESLRLDIAITVPCYVEEIDEVQERLAKKVYRMLEEEEDKHIGDD